MMNVILATLLVLSATLNCGYTSIDVSEAPCPAGWTEVEAACFKYFNMITTWSAARAACRQSPGAHLAHVTLGNHGQLEGLLTDIPIAWIGLTSREETGVWQWDWGERYVNVNEAGGHVDLIYSPGVCVYMSNSGDFYQVLCDSDALAGYICQMDNADITTPSLNCRSLDGEPCDVIASTRTILDSTTVGSTTVDSAAADSTTVDSTTVDSTRVDSTTVDSTTVESSNPEIEQNECGGVRCGGRAAEGRTEEPSYTTETIIVALSIVMTVVIVGVVAHKDLTETDRTVVNPCAEYRGLPVECISLSRVNKVHPVDG